MQTKKDEHIVTVTNAEELEQLDRKRFCYAAANILSSYDEDFLDEDTGETVTVERNEVLYHKGDTLFPDDFSALLFHFQCGRLKKVVLSNQQRNGSVNSTYWRLWQVKATGAAKLDFLLRAPSIAVAYEIATDYIELHHKGGYIISNIKAFDASTVIEYDNLDPSKNKKTDDHWYTISVIEKPATDEENGFADDGDELEPVNYICYADSVETAKAIIEKYIAEDKAVRHEYEPYTLNILSAKTISSTDIVPVSFCMAYKQDQEGGDL